MSIDLVGNTLSQSTYLGTISGSLTRKERIGGTDRKDYYSFSLNSHSGFTASLSNLKANANLYLLNSAGQTLLKSTNISSFPEFISTALEAGTYYIRVSSRSALSTGYKLTLSSTPDSSIQVLSPGTANSLTPGSTTAITWTDNLGENVSIDLYKGGNFYTTLFSSTASDGVENWVVPTSLPNGSDYQIRISSTINSAIYDESDGSFVINPNVTVTSPNGGGNFLAGASYSINWTDNLSENAKIDLYKGGAFFSTITSSTPSDGNETWIIPSNLASASNYQIRISSTTDSSVFDDSDAVFTITASSSPYITVTSPNGGNSFQAGSSYSINWTNNLNENVKIDLYKGGNFFSTITSSTANDGSEAWLVPSNLAPGSDYQIRISGTTSSNVFDDSDTSFTIQSPPSNSFDIVFDYRYDTTGWFTSARKAALEAAASVWKSIILDEFTDIPVGTTLSVVDPETLASDTITSNTVIDDLLIFVGATNLGSGTLGMGGPSGTWFTGSTLDTRFNGNDFEPWTGFISFNSTSNWYFDSTPSTTADIPFSSYDFISVAVHEMGHVLGIGSSDAYQNWVSGGSFVGPNAEAQNGGNPIPLEYDVQNNDYPHVQDGYTYGTSGEAAMDPSLQNGVRKLPNALDIALLDDIGYSVNYSAF